MTTIYILLSLLFFALALTCEWAERKSRRWYQDRMMLRGSGFCFAVATICSTLALYYL